MLPAPWTGHSPISLPLARHCYSLRYNNIVIRTVNIPIMTKVLKWKGDSHISHFKSKARNDLAYWGMAVQSQAEIGWKLVLLGQITQGKVLEGNFMCYSSEYMRGKKAEHSYCWYGESCSGLDRRSSQPHHFLKSQSWIQRKALVLLNSEG